MVCQTSLAGPSLIQKRYLSFCACRAAAGQARVPLEHHWKCHLTESPLFDILETMKSQAVVKTLSALAQDNRLAIFRLLVEQGPEGLTPGAIAEKLQIPAPTLSFHLKELANAGLISPQQSGRFIVYSVDFLAMRELVEFLYHNCCGVGVAGCGPECIPAIEVKVASPKVKLMRSK
jgi:ArsR family transcriptional regulator, arsenate/arsenite/antimonite-responsive transcriptional repressor